MAACDGYRYAGMMNGKECWCGNELDSARIRPFEECNVPCAGDPSNMCGGEEYNGWNGMKYIMRMNIWDKAGK